MGKRFEKLPRLAAYALAGLSLAVANALRPDAPLVLVPLLAYFVFRFLSKASWNHFFHYLKRFGALLITFLVVSAGMSGMVKIAGINSIGLTNQDPLWSIVLGTNTETGGTFTYDDSNAVVALTDQGMERSQAEIQVIKEHLQVSPFKLVETLGSKNENSVVGPRTWLGAGQRKREFAHPVCPAGGDRSCHVHLRPVFGGAGGRWRCSADHGRILSYTCFLSSSLPPAVCTW